MAVQSPVFLDHLGFPVNNASSQDWIAAAPNSGLGFPDLVQPLHSGFFNPDPAPAPAPAPNLHQLRFSNALADEFDRQTREIDIFLQLQSERLRCAIQQQNKKQIATLLSSIESKALARVRKMEQDLAKAVRRTRELEECLRRAEVETESWKKTAMENEEMVVGLNNLLGQARERLCWASGNSGPAQDEESVFECDWAAVGGESCQVGGEDETQRMGCKGCKTQRSCVVFLPCKHLCACRQCGGFLGMCPVCKSVKQGTVEVFFD